MVRPRPRRGRSRASPARGTRPCAIQPGHGSPDLIELVDPVPARVAAPGGEPVAPRALTPHAATTAYRRPCPFRLRDKKCAEKSATPAGPAKTACRPDLGAVNVVSAVAVWRECLPHELAASAVLTLAARRRRRAYRVLPLGDG